MSARQRFVAALVPLLLLSWVATGTVGAEHPPINGDIPPGGGLAILTVGAATTPEGLVAALVAKGCQPVSIFITVDGAFVGLIPGAPAFVNAAFPTELAAGTGFITRCAPPPVALGNQCTSAAGGYTIRYPTTWYANTNTVVGPCVAFSDQPVVVPAESELIAPIVIARVPSSLEAALAQLTPMFYTILWQSETTVAGRDAVRIETRATGEGLLEAGVDQYSYYVRINAGATLILTATEIEGLDYPGTRLILDAMIGTLEIH